MRSPIFIALFTLAVLTLCPLVARTVNTPPAAATNVTAPSAPQGWGSVTIGKDKDGHIDVMLENSRLRVRYGFFQSDQPTGESGIMEFMNKRTKENEVRPTADTTNAVIDACAGRSLLTNASVTADTPAVKTVRLEFITDQYEGDTIEDVSIFPDSPYIKIDYRKYGVNIVDIATPGGSFSADYAIYGADKWKRGYDLYEKAYYCHSFHDIGYQNITGVDQPGPLNYHGWFVLNILNAANGRGYGVLAPVADIDIVKLLFKRGFELFPHYMRYHAPYTSYIYLVEGGATNAIHTGKQIADKVGAAPSLAQRTNQWWNPAWRYRLPIYVDPNGYARTNQPVEVSVDFNAALAKSGKPFIVNPKSLRLVEMTDEGMIDDSAVPCQYDPNPIAKNKGVLTLLVNGNLEKDWHRHYYLYFDEQGRDLPAMTVPPQVSVVDSIPYQGQDTLKITTSRATYFLQKQGGGFASILDNDGHDWVSYHPADGPAGEYRGIPNLGIWCHPGYPAGSKNHVLGNDTRIVSAGPLKLTVHVVSTDKQYACTWDFFPTFARLTIEKVGASYWMLYEGTPGGKFEPEKDFIMKSNGEKIPATQRWEGALPAPEWLYFGKGDSKRALFYAHHEADNIVDSFWPMSDAQGQPQMTVFGFGRSLENLDFRMTAVPTHFTIGFCEDSAFEQASRTIAAAYLPLTVAVGTADRYAK
jgi:hypothetical protein